jgi:hypothetical protein
MPVGNSYVVHVTLNAVAVRILEGADQEAGLTTHVGEHHPVASLGAALGLTGQNPEGGGLMLTMEANKEGLKNTPTFKSKKEQDAEKQAAEPPRNIPSPTPPPKN